MEHLFGGRYAGRRVLVTGHTGFKGSWLALWLSRLGAIVGGYALEANTAPSHYNLISPVVDSTIEDIRDLEKLCSIVHAFRPEIVFHLAAQPLVRCGFAEPVETFSTNVMGTVNLLEACRKVPSIQAVVIVTSDKCYENREPNVACIEADPMGGADPYSASKGCAELVANAYRTTYFNISDYGDSHQTLIASTRAGNAIGGGDWAQDRLIPDIMKAAAEKKAVHIRYPRAERPWQHVLEPLSGYLWLGTKLLEGDVNGAEGWNFGPKGQSMHSVERIVSACQEHWHDINMEYDVSSSNCPESACLRLDCTKAFQKLQWRPVWDIDTTLKRTVNWYKAYYSEKKVLTGEDLDAYIKDAALKGLPWT